MVTAALVDQETKVPLCIATTCPDTAEMDDRGQVLLLLEHRRSVSDYFRYVTVEVCGGQLDRVAWDDSGVETVEPTGVEVVPRPVFDDHMVVNTVALPFLKCAVVMTAVEWASNNAPYSRHVSRGLLVSAFSTGKNNSVGL
jgi:hypothetical protein